MNKYQSPIADPQLSRVEQSVYQLICNLDAAQTSHRYSDPNAPSPPSLWKFMFRPRAAKEQRLADLKQYWLKNGFPVPVKPLSLAKLLPLINPPRELTPRRIELEDLYWDGFVISQRFRDWKHGYIVAAPISSEPFRCVVLVSSGRLFCSSLVRANCGPPTADDFSWVVMRTNTRDLDIRRARACERRRSSVYLPSCYAPWIAMN